MRTILTISTLIFLAQFSFGQSNFTFTIEQLSLPGGHIANYEFDGEKLFISENERLKEKLRLKQDEIYHLDSLARNIGLDTLKASYSRPVIDGIRTTFEFKRGTKTKKITLTEYYLENLDRLLREVNILLKEKHQIISLGDDMISEPDTIVYYLPDFYVDTVVIPDNYDFYRIMCFRKGYFETQIIDSIHLCDCRIYPTDNNGENEKRHYWRAYRLENDSWKREYFDNQNNVFKTEFVHDIVPYEIVKEKVHSDIGAKPSVEIYRYYETEIRRE